MVFFKMLGGKTVVCNALIIEIILFLLKKYLMRCISVFVFYVCLCVPKDLANRRTDMFPLYNEAS